MHGGGLAGAVGILRPAISVTAVGPAQREAIVHARCCRADGQAVHVVICAFQRAAQRLLADKVNILPAIVV